MIQFKRCPQSKKGDREKMVGYMAQAGAAESNHYENKTKKAGRSWVGSTTFRSVAQYALRV
jgi:hypothetical protein